MSNVVNPGTGALFPRTVALGGATTAAKVGSMSVCGTTAGAVTVQRPASRTEGSIFAVFDGDGNSATNNITVDGNGDLIDGAATVIISQASATAVFLFDGGQWRRQTPRRAVAGMTQLLEFDADAIPHAATLSPVADITTTGNLLLGPTPRAATTGLIRVASGQNIIAARNAANSADIVLFATTGADVLALAPNVSIATSLALGASLVLQASAALTGAIRLPDEPTGGLVIVATSAGTDYAGLSYSAAAASWTAGNASHNYFVQAYAAQILGNSAGVSFYDGRNLLTTDSAKVSQHLTANDTTTLAAGKATNFGFTVVAGEVWVIEWFGNLGCSGVGGVTLGVVAPAGSTVDGQVFGCTGNSATFSSNSVTSVNAQNAQPFSTVAGAAERMAHLKATVTIGANGTLGLSFGAFTGGQTATMFAKAHFEARRSNAV